jgi:hypothetical protein
MKLNGLIIRQEGEEVIFYLRRHWIVFAADIAMIFILAAVPLGALLLSSSTWPDLLIGPISGPLIKLLAGAYYLIIWLFFITTFVDYYLDAWIVTTRRVVNVEQHSLFSRTVSELDLSKVQDVTSEVKGILPSILNYGYVHVQSAGSTERFVFEQVPRPDDIRKKLLEFVKRDQAQELEAVKSRI